jgi:hypothetical protein
LPLLVPSEWLRQQRDNSRPLPWTWADGIAAWLPLPGTEPISSTRTCWTQKEKPVRCEGWVAMSHALSVHRPEMTAVQVRTR